MPESSKVNFPCLLSATLKNVSLYTAHDVIVIPFDRSVTTLVGANGIGKSTCLSILAFGATGLVPQPGRSFKTPIEYYDHCLDFPRQYFDGRITEFDRDAASVGLTLTIGGYEYTLERGLFDKEGLRELHIRAPDGSTLYSGENATEAERHRRYTEFVVQHAGIRTFPHFCFLQHFVLGFDELHHLLFWDAPVLESVLFLAFGVSQESALRAEELRREAEKKDSRARNANWQAAEVNKKLREIKNQYAATTGTQDPDVQREHDRISDALLAAQETVDHCQALANDAELLHARAQARLAALQREFNTVFTHQFAPMMTWHRHPLIGQSQAGHKCGLCGETSDAAQSAIAAALQNSECPLCRQVTTPSAPPTDGSKLAALDAEMSACQAGAAEGAQKLYRTQDELANAARQLELLKEEHARFVGTHPDVARSRKSGPGEDQPDKLFQLINTYEEQFTSLNADKATFYAQRDKAKRELQGIQRDLERQYLEAEEEFVPRFTSLAQRFLGVDLSVTMASHPTVQLIVEVRGARRRSHYSLSESQKYFVDIALRMAIAQHMASPDGPATLFIDTPEGSLDIAYEARAGEMFAEFVKAGNRIIMTANINSSKLLLRLAERCGAGRMTVVRMTEWAELTDVQRAEATLFEDAFAQIDKNLQQGG